MEASFRLDLVDVAEWWVRRTHDVKDGEIQMTATQTRADAFRAATKPIEITWDILKAKVTDGKRVMEVCAFSGQTGELFCKWEEDEYEKTAWLKAAALREVVD